MILRNNELRFLLQDRQIKKRQEEKGRLTYTGIIYINVLLNLTLNGLYQEEKTRIYNTKLNKCKSKQMGLELPLKVSTENSFTAFEDAEKSDISCSTTEKH